MNLSEMIDKEYAPLIPSFIKNQYIVFNELEVALVSDDMDTVKFLAHRLKGTSENYGFKQLGAYADDLEYLLENNTIFDIRELIVNMRTYLNLVEIIYIEL